MPTMRGVTSDRRERTVAVVVLCGAAASALLVGVVDTVTLRSRLIDEIATARPLWLHTFSIAMLTAGLAASRLVIGRPFGPPGRIACVLLAALNLTVPILELGRRGLGPVLSWLHVPLAVLLVATALVGADPHDDRPPAVPHRPSIARRPRPHAQHH